MSSPTTKQAEVELKTRFQGPGSAALERQFQKVAEQVGAILTAIGETEKFILQMQRGRSEVNGMRSGDLRFQKIAIDVKPRKGVIIIAQPNGRDSCHEFRLWPHNYGQEVGEDRLNHLLQRLKEYRPGKLQRMNGATEHTEHLNGTKGGDMQSDDITERVIETAAHEPQVAAPVANTREEETALKLSFLLAVVRQSGDAATLMVERSLALQHMAVEIGNKHTSTVLALLREWHNKYIRLGEDSIVITRRGARVLRDHGFEVRDPEPIIAREEPAHEPAPVVAKPLLDENAGEPRSGAAMPLEAARPAVLRSEPLVAEAVPMATLPPITGFDPGALKQSVDTIQGAVALYEGMASAYIGVESKCAKLMAEERTVRERLDELVLERRTLEARLTAIGEELREQKRIGQCPDHKAAHDALRALRATLGFLK